MNDNEKVIKLYQFIDGLSQLKTTSILNIEKEDWKIFLDSLPSDQVNIKLFQRNAEIQSSYNEDASLLEIKKPNFTPCPPPPKELSEWLEYGWEDFHRDVSIVKSKLKEDGTLELFESSAARGTALLLWQDQRNLWKLREELTDSVRELFSKLYQAYKDLERDSSSIELVLGNGILTLSDNAEIKYPLLLRKMSLKFDSQKDIIKLCDTDADSELYTLFLKDISGLDLSLMDFESELNQENYHPLDYKEASEFLSKITHHLSSSSYFRKDKSDTIPKDERVIVTFSPVLFIRKKIDGTHKAVDSIIKDININHKVPSHILEIAGISLEHKPIETTVEKTYEQKLSEVNGESLDILLVKEANREQLQIAERIEHSNAVLVQGPPGTGKTHTIANLLGHFMSQGKTILVTSQTAKALSVLKSKLPKQLQNLCISLLDDSNKDMVKAIEEIADILSNPNTNEHIKEQKALSIERQNLLISLEDNRRKIHAIRSNEHQNIIYEGQSITPIQAAKYINEHKKYEGIIPGSVKFIGCLPLSFDELRFLYSTNSQITTEQEKELSIQLPRPNSLDLTPEDFHSLVLKRDETLDQLKRMENSFQRKIEIDYEENVMRIGNDWLVRPLDLVALSELKAKMTDFTLASKKWMLQAALDGIKGGAHKSIWEKLIQDIDEIHKYKEKEDFILTLYGKDIIISDAVSSDIIYRSMYKLYRYFCKKHRPSFIFFLFNPECKKAYYACKINNQHLQSQEDCQAIIYYLELQDKRQKLINDWTTRFSSLEGPDINLFGKEPEDKAYQMIDEMRYFLNWDNSTRKTLYELSKRAGLNTKYIFSQNNTLSDIDAICKEFNQIDNNLRVFTKLEQILLDLIDNENRFKSTLLELNNFELAKSHVCSLLKQAILNHDIEIYTQGYTLLTNLFSLKEDLEKRNLLLNKLSENAPEWANAISLRKDIHGASSCPENIQEIWKWKQLNAKLIEFQNLSIDDLQQETVKFSTLLRKNSEKLASYKAWEHILSKIDENLKIRQALFGWMQTIKNIGKGTGNKQKIAGLRVQARKQMKICQQAVAAWIMPINKVFNTFAPGENTFDIIIIDEASQCDITVLALLYMGKKIIIVGDDKQVTPMAVGIEDVAIDNLQNMYIANIVPNYKNYNLKQSLFSLAQTSFTTLMLKEHFRCVPNIIGFSNMNFYQNKIKPLRSETTSSLLPSVISHRVHNGTRRLNKINTEEAETIAALITACLERPEYKGKTFGIISLLGQYQALEIGKLIYKHIPVSEIEERHIQWGDAYHFQGDERDVIFLSMVDSGKDDGPLSLQQRTEIQQRYNVAASRPKDQLWIIHSLDYVNDLKHDDIRRKLLEYAENPQEFITKSQQIQQKSDSPFEAEVCTSLVASGYHCIQQYPVGAYRIDIVVQYKNKKIAIECDGERYHCTDEQIFNDMERQTILERLGWTFIRIRGSEYFKSPNSTIEKLIAKLQNYGLYPEENTQLPSDSNNYPLRSTICQRAYELLEEWHSQDNLQESIHYQSI